MVEPDSKVQTLADEFNRKYWKATGTSEPKDYFDACLIGRQLVLELGAQKILHDKLLDPEIKDKYTLGK